MKTLLKTKNMFGFILMVLLGLHSAIAQDEENEIKVQITKEEDGEVKTFEKTYSDEQEMESDEELREFMDERNHPFWLTDDEAVIRLSDSAGNDFSFDFHVDDDEIRKHIKRFQLSDSSMKELEIHLEKLGDELATIDIDISEKMRELEENGVFELKPGSIRIATNLQEQLDDLADEDFDIDIDLKRVEISDDVSAFGRLGAVKEKRLLTLENLSYYPNPSANGRFKLKFKTPEQGELSIKIYNLDGKEVFYRYFENYYGSFSETIDLSNQKAGMYLLEIDLEGKRLTRKIVIE